ncbi:MAG: molecular chaperone [Lachnospiraceae bacterium]|nr:molecular chaperone [Lachnospiraceae bacterium]
MEDLREQQVEALQVLKEYNQKLTKSVLLVVEELRGKRQKDTDEFLKKIIEGINWEIQIYNGTKELINADMVRVDKEEMNRHVMAFGEAVEAKDDAKIADSFEADILPLLTKLGDAAEEVLGKEQTTE